MVSFFQGLPGLVLSHLRSRSAAVRVGARSQIPDEVFSGPTRLGGEPCVRAGEEPPWERAAARHRAAIGRVYNAGPSKPTSLYELIITYRELTGSGPRILPVSAGIINSLSWLAPQATTLLTLNIHLDMRRAAEELGYQPYHSLKEGLALTLAS